MKDTATVSFVGIPDGWKYFKTVAGVWSEHGRYYSGLTPTSNSVSIPIRGRFIVREWRFIFLAEVLNRTLIVWKGAPVDGKELLFEDGREIPFRLLDKWGYEPGP